MSFPNPRVDTDTHDALRQLIVNLLERTTPAGDQRPCKVLPNDVYLFSHFEQALYELCHANWAGGDPNVAVLGHCVWQPQDFTDFGVKTVEKFHSHFALDSYVRYSTLYSDKGEPVDAVFVQMPAGINSHSYDLRALREYADQYDFCLAVVDEASGCLANVDVMPYADVLVVALARPFTGVDKFAGVAMVMNPASKYYPYISQRVISQGSQDLHVDLADAATEDADDLFMLRWKTINENTTAIVNALLATDHVNDICNIYHPSLSNCGDFYAQIMRPPTEEFTAGHGEMFMIEFPSEAGPRIFMRGLKFKKVHLDAVLKGPPTAPGLYGKLNGLKENQLVFCVGVEHQDELVEAFEEAIEEVFAANVYPTQPPVLPSS